ncbi:hypothetical protein [Novipirellula aureliae]|uniref:hypothetical protein n=1 Tax=Novipirellula aureliae TaxID=2527966 RepID=UPI0011B3BF57|nr:hypothetical protein [Novipirellula aureliae]
MRTTQRKNQCFRHSHASLSIVSHLPAASLEFQAADTSGAHAFHGRPQEQVRNHGDLALFLPAALDTLRPNA